jgi:Protein of unknown function (DUF559)
MTDRMISHRLATGLWTLLHPGVHAVAGRRRRGWATCGAPGWPPDRRPWPATRRPAATRRGGPPRAPSPGPPHRAPRHASPGGRCRGSPDRRPRTRPRLRGRRPAGHHARPSGRRPRSAGGAASPRRDRRRRDPSFDLDRPHRPLHRGRRRRGKPGIARLGAVLDARGPGHVPPASVLEGALFGALAAAELPAPARQFRLPGRGAVDGLVDAAYPDVRLLLEADGRRWHSRINDLRRDHQRDAEAARAGWQTLRLLHEDVVGHPDEVADMVGDVRTARASRLASLSA